MCFVVLFVSLSVWFCVSVRFMCAGFVILFVFCVFCLGFVSFMCVLGAAVTFCVYV